MSNLKVENHEYDKNYDDEFCIDCFEEFESFQKCVVFTNASGRKEYMCNNCFREYQQKIINHKIEDNL